MHVRRIPFIRLGLPLLTLALLATVAAGAEPLTTGPTHRGVISVGPYQVFPENRPGNAVYVDNVLLFSLPGQTIQDIVNLPATNKFIYLVRQGDTRTVAVRNGPADPAPRITEVSPGYYFVVTVLDGIAYKKVLHAAGANLVDLLPLSKTADGVTVGATGLVFYHIGKADQDANGKPQYSLGVHYVSFADGKVHHLGDAVENSQPSLTFKWVNDTSFQYTLADGTTHTLNVSDLK